MLNTYAPGGRICEEGFGQCNIHAWPLHDNMHSVRLMTINYANDDVGSSDKLEAQERDVFSGWSCMARYDPLDDLPWSVRQAQI